MMPAGYRPGALIAKVRRDLGALGCDAVSDTCVRFRANDSGLEFLAEERVEPQFLMHVVTTRFSCRIPCEGGEPVRIKIRHRGAWKRSGIECVTAHGNDPVANQLPTDTALAAALLPLDFTEFELERQAGAWEARLIHYGASEVVYRFPPIRQYVRLPPEQVRAMLETFTSLRRTPLLR